MGKKHAGPPNSRLQQAVSSQVAHFHLQHTGAVAKPPSPRGLSASLLQPWGSAHS